MRPTACMSSVSRKVGPRRALRWRYRGVAMCTKGRGTNSVNPPVSLLEVPGADHVPGPRPGLLDGAEHDGHVGSQADPVGRPVGEEPLLGVDLVGAQHGPHLVVEDLGRRARQGPEAGVTEEHQIVGQGHARTAGPFGHLESGEAVDVDGGGGRPDGPDHVEVVVAVELGVDPPLQADLGGAQRFGLTDPVGDLVEGEQIGGPARLRDSGPLEKAQNRHLKVQTLV